MTFMAGGIFLEPLISYVLLFIWQLLGISVNRDIPETPFQPQDLPYDYGGLIEPYWIGHGVNGAQSIKVDNQANIPLSVKSKLKIAEKIQSETNTTVKWSEVMQVSKSCA